MRRIVALTCLALVTTAFAGCRSDGREMRSPTPRQNASISTIAASTTLDPAAVDGGILDTSPATLPTAGAPVTLSAPWRDGTEIDPRYTCDGADVSPALLWGAAPAGTVEIAVTLTDLDVPDTVHWVIAALDPSRTTLAESEVPPGAIQATNDFGVLGYSGPCNEPGTVDRYRFTVHFLSQQMELGDGAAGDDLRLAVEAATFSSAEVVGLYSRP